ncbi:hypothetical protein QN277_003606 [Acacia crassicarpa]|uniref:Uncharacterized protein n=1 Tax=Acacia crassicarpa TaxID=499986 RepID=A0AAE1IYW6_9FABA|nr:hypothetical protein QN277_003606 [Acacia crassicarpa]
MAHKFAFTLTSSRAFAAPSNPRPLIPISSSLSSPHASSSNGDHLIQFISRRDFWLRCRRIFCCPLIRPPRINKVSLHHHRQARLKKVKKPLTVKSFRIVA